MNLTVIEKSAVQNLPVKQQQFVQAKFGRAIKNYQDNELAPAVLDIIQVTLMEAGVKDQGDRKVIQFLAETLFRDLKTDKFNHLSLEEIKLALSYGVRCEYGQYMGVNIGTMHSWIKSFLSDKAREQAIKDFNKKLSEMETSNKPVYFTREHFIKAARDAFEEYKACGKLPMVSHAIYDTIRELKGVKTLIRADEWAAIKAEAQTSYEEQMTKGVHKSKVGEILARLDYTLPDKNGNGNRSFEFHVKKIALKRYFDSIDKLEI